MFTVVIQPSSGAPEPVVAHLSLETGDITRLIPGGRAPRYVPTGQLLYASEGALRAVRFDPARVEILGNPFPVVEDVGDDYAVSSNGTLVYLPLLVGRREFLVSWIEREGRATPLGLPASHVGNLSLSPCGDRIALDVTDESGRNIWVYDIERGTMGKRTFGGSNSHPIWTPDGGEILYAGNTFRSVMRVRADGSSAAEELPVELPGAGVVVPTSWSEAHRTLLFLYGSGVWRLSLDERSAAPFLSRENADIQEARFSPDERWVAYRSNETGRDEIYVVPYPGPGGKYQISNEGGAQPMWSPTGRELFYKSGNRMMAVEVEAGSSFAAGVPRALFENPLPERSVSDPSRYAVSPDGQRFLVAVSAPGPDADDPLEIHVVVNWFQELERMSRQEP